jgi:acyl-CoA reductase-like NAD-dependent aldehyde dehydrogenase
MNIALPQPSVDRRHRTVPASDESFSSLTCRLRCVRRFRQLLADQSRQVAATVDAPVAEVLAGQVVPLAQACRFLERRAAAILAPRRHGNIEIRREPFGRILVIGPANFPLFLPAVHALQALVAGNAVTIKPGNGGLPAMSMFAKLLFRAGIPDDKLQILDESILAAHQAIEEGVDKVVFTGSADAGAAVYKKLASRLVPATMELSGHDPMIVRADADVSLVMRALNFGRTFNNGNICIAPRRLIVHETMTLPGAQDATRFRADEEAVSLANASEYALGATIFTRDLVAARSIADQLNAGIVVINDMIAPTADPRVPFGGRDRSGFGVTRGAEGLLEMTQIKTIINQRRRWLPHRDGARDEDAPMFEAILQLAHGTGLIKRFRALNQLISALSTRRKNT